MTGNGSPEGRGLGRLWYRAERAPIAARGAESATSYALAQVVNTVSIRSMLRGMISSAEPGAVPAASPIVNRAAPCRTALCRAVLAESRASAFVWDRARSFDPERKRRALVGRAPRCILGWNDADQYRRLVTIALLIRFRRGFGRRYPRSAAISTCIGGLFDGILAAAIPAGAAARDGLAHSCSERVSVRDLRAKTLVDLF